MGFDGFTYDEKVVQYGTTFDVSEAMPDIAGVAFISDPDERCVILHLPEYWRVAFAARDGAAERSCRLGFREGVGR